MPDDALERLVRIETKLDSVVDGRADHESRLRHLEQWMWRAAGAAAVVGGLVGAAAGAVVR